MPPMPERFGRYQVVKLLGEGGMGAVYLATDSSLGRKVALKIPQLGGPDAAQLVERFHREAQAAAKLDHPNICPVFDVGEIDGKPYLTMRYIEGRPLSRYINPERLQSPRNVALIIRKLADALAHAHAHGVVHRDLKPANIMVDAKNEPVVMDFGLARQMGGANEKQVTQSGMIVGTPAYMSPEQVGLESDQVDARTDIWSLGVIFFEMLTGKLPYDGTVMQIIGALQHLDPPTAREVAPTAPERLSAICKKMMTRDRDQRYQTMRAVADDVAAWIRDPSAGMSEGDSDHALASVALPRPGTTPDTPPRTQFDFAASPMTAVGPKPSSPATEANPVPADIFASLLQSSPPETVLAAKPKKNPPRLWPTWALPGGGIALAFLLLMGVFIAFSGRKVPMETPPTGNGITDSKLESNHIDRAPATKEVDSSRTDHEQPDAVDARIDKDVKDVASKVVGSVPLNREEFGVEVARGVVDSNAPRTDKRSRWVFDHGSFDRIDNGTWLESKIKGERFWFNESVRTTEYVELDSKTADYQVRLFERHSEIRRNRGLWSLLFSGVWSEAPATRAATTPSPDTPRSGTTNDARVDPPPAPAIPDSLKPGVERLRRSLLGYRWNYVDSKHPPGGPVRFYPNGKFHDQWKWNYWVVGPKTMHVQFWDPNYASNKSVVFTFNDDLTQFSAQFDGHRVTGKRLDPVKKTK